MRKLITVLAMFFVVVTCGLASNYHYSVNDNPEDRVLNGEDETSTWCFEDFSYETLITQSIQLNDVEIYLAYSPKSDCYGLIVPNARGGYTWCQQSRDFALFRYVNLTSGIRIDFEGDTYIFWYEDVNPFN